MDTISEKRSRLYNIALIISAIFGILLVAGMTIFKLNEDYFNGNIRFQHLMESMGTKEDEISYSKVNIKVDFSNGGDKSLFIPLEMSIDEDCVTVREEFTENKYVISLAGYGEYIKDEIKLVGDLGIMDAAGAYSQDGNVIVEVYCNDTYDYDVVVADSSITVNFYDLGVGYDYSAVIWTPYLEKNRFSISTFEDELVKFAEDEGIKLYLTWNLENEYTQNDIVEFANNIGADMVIGIDIEYSDDKDSYMSGVCNTSYFIPDFDSASLSVKLVEGFAQAVDFQVREFDEADVDMPIVYEAVVPAAAIRFYVSESENEYNFTENIIDGIKYTINGVIMEWRQSDNEGE
jgi:hypothetical protein